MIRSRKSSKHRVLQQMHRLFSISRSYRRSGALRNPRSLLAEDHADDVPLAEDRLVHGGRRLSGSEHAGEE